ncbi:RHS repeat-associated core domain-containing protein [Pseudocolwellia sp. HL-MZ7]|uniref:RHS repeat-associated core domain-containing protein n=1 Tax=Pseudocolwellia sp. HL-MZ7 TaxID=3400627 RepID=UPI003CE67004
MHYYPFGESIETPKDDVGYTGHKFDTDLGLSYMQARYYDPVIGRFYSNDPVGVRDVQVIPPFLMEFKSRRFSLC